jgi:long-chain acyl-CoA synthetase
MPSTLDPQVLRTLCGLFLARVAATPDRVAYRQFDEAAGAWVSYSWRQVAAEAARWQAALAQEDLEPGDRVAVMLKNCVEWVVFDQAALGLGLVTVPLYCDDRPESAAYILNHSGAKLLLVEGRHQFRQLAALANAAPGVRRIVALLPPESGVRDALPVVVTAEAWLARASGTSMPARAVAAGDLASLVYTSGTTGPPKGVMLSHDNLLWNAFYASHSADFGTDAVFLSFLPLSHALERTGGYYLPMLLGAEVAYARSIAQLGQDLLEIRPTVLISVPRIYERVYARLQAALEKKSALARRLFALAVEVGWRRFERRQRRAGWHPMLLLWPLLDRLVAREVVARLGGCIRLAISGGAALSPEIARVFVGLGVPIYQGYGLTEASPVVCVNRPDANLPSSIGQPIEGVEVALGPDGELLTRSRCVMRGYWRDEAATREVIDEAGWLHSGDLASVDGSGHYLIVGRIKDIIVLNNGEKVSPTDMESTILLDPLFEQVMVVGEGRAYLAAVTVLNAEEWRGFAAELDVDPGDPASLRDPRVTKALIRRIAHGLRHFPGYAQIRRLVADLRPWTVEDGLLTPTLKTKRSQVQDHYREAIAAMYADFAR